MGLEISQMSSLHQQRSPPSLRKVIQTVSELCCIVVLPSVLPASGIHVGSAQLAVCNACDFL